MNNTISFGRNSGKTIYYFDKLLSCDHDVVFVCQNKKHIFRKFLEFLKANSVNYSVCEGDTVKFNNKRVLFKGGYEHHRNI